MYTLFDYVAEKLAILKICFCIICQYIAELFPIL